MNNKIYLLTIEDPAYISLFAFSSDKLRQEFVDKYRDSALYDGGVEIYTSEESVDGCTFEEYYEAYKDELS